MTITLAVTGGIGSGKSLVCSLFQEKGVPVYCSDDRTKALYDRCPGLVERMSQALGCDLSLPSGGLDRRRLASVIFSDSRQLAVLESIVHPEVHRDFLEWKEAQGNVPCGFVIMESAILLEKPLFKETADRILIVDAPVELRKERACARDHADRSQIEARMSRQPLLNAVSEGKITPSADYIIVNDGTPEQLEAQVDAIYEELRQQQLK